MTNYNWKITAKKFLIILAEVMLAGSIVYLTDNHLWLILVPALEALRNYIRHR